MRGDVFLQFAGSFLTFFLQAAVACLICVGFTRLLRHPQHRFLAWLAFLAATALYWTVLTGELALKLLLPPGELGPQFPGAVPSHGLFLLPVTWTLWLGWLIAVAGFAYVAGVLWLGYRHARRSLSLRALVNLGSPPSAGLAGMVQSMCREIGIRRCELVVLPGLASPATVYWWKPRILLPEECNHGETTPQLKDVLRHELVHIVRRDYLISGISDAICAVLFFHPAVWHARKQMRLERELACDLAVVDERPDHRADYADTLALYFRLSMLQEHAVSQGMDFAGSAEFLAHRVRCVLTDPAHIPWWKKLLTATAGCALWAAFAGLAPALAVALGFASEPFSLSWSAPRQTMPVLQRHSAAIHPPSEAALGATATPAALPDTMTSLRVQDRAYGTEEFQPAPPETGGGISGETDLNGHAWSERSPASVRTSGPSVRSIVLATIGGVAAAEKKERTGHGHTR